MANPNKMGGNTSPPFGTIPTGGRPDDGRAPARGPTEDATMLSKGLVKISLMRYAPLPPSLSSWDEVTGSSASRGRPLSQLDAYSTTRCPATHSMRIVRPSGLACCFKRSRGPWAPSFRHGRVQSSQPTAIALFKSPAQAGTINPCCINLAIWV